MSTPLSLQTLPPSTRAVLASNQSAPNSNPSSIPSSPISTGSTPHGFVGQTQNPNPHPYADADTFSISSGLGPGTTRTPRPGASLINIHATSQNLSLSSSTSSSNPNPATSSAGGRLGGGGRVMRGGSMEHLGNYEHHSYGIDDDEMGTRSYQSGGYTPTSYGTSSPAGYGSPRHTTSHLRANRAAAAAAADSYINLGSASPSAPGLHALHSKGSNLSTNTFMPRSSAHEGENGSGSDMISSPLTPGAVTPTPGNTVPFTPNSTNNSNQGTLKSSLVDNKNGDEKSTPTAPQSASLVPGGNHVLKSKSSVVTPQSPRVRDRRSGKERDRERDKERDREGDHRRAKIRAIPHLPHGSGEPAPSTLMYWSRAPVYGQLPTRSMRAHSVTLVDNTAWLFGGCDERGCARDVWCCDIETFQWTHPSLTGDVPPPCRAHTATLVDGKRIFIFGGGEGPTYYNTLYILDTQTRRFTWVPCGQKPAGAAATDTVTAETPSSGPSSTSTPSSANPPLPTPTANDTQMTNGSNGSAQTGSTITLLNPSPASNGPTPPMPLPRRAHTAVLYRSKLYIFGGGNGVRALNDVWCLDTSVAVEKMRWEQVKTSGPRPGPRGYHTANLVANNMIVVGGSDGRECFSDIWVLNLDTLVWTLVDTDKEYKRLSHSSTQVGSYLFIMGGHDGLKYSSELLLFNLVTLQFEQKLTMGRPPPARGYHVSLLADARLLVFGGFDGHSVFDDVWLLDLAGAAYLPQVTSFALLIESGH